MRASVIQAMPDSTSTTSHTPSPSSLAAMMTTIRPGNASSVSVRRISTASMIPP